MKIIFKYSSGKDHPEDFDKYIADALRSEERGTMENLEETVGSQTTIIRNLILIMVKNKLLTAREILVLTGEEWRGEARFEADTE